MNATKEQIKECFDSYDAADKEVSAAKAAYEAALKVRSGCVKKILDTTGSKGPYSYKGSQVIIVQRDETLFFRGKSKGEVISVD